MKRRNPWIWLLAGGTPLAAAVYFGGGGGAISPTVALAQTAGAQAPAPDAPANGQAVHPDANAANGPDQPWVAMTDFLRWQLLPFQERQQIRNQGEAQEWAKLLDFMRDNCPNRSAMLERQSLNANSPVRQRLLLRWENIQRLQREQPELYNSEIDQLKQEDVLIGLGARINQARNRQDEPRRSELWRQLQAESLKLVEMDLHERDLRLQNAQTLLAAQQANLQRDEANKEQLARIRARDFLRQVGLGRQFGPNRGGPPPSGTEDSQPNGQTNSPSAAEIAPAKPQH